MRCNVQCEIETEIYRKTSRNYFDSIRNLLTNLLPALQRWTYKELRVLIET